MYYISFEVFINYFDWWIIYQSLSRINLFGIWDIGVSLCGKINIPQRKGYIIDCCLSLCETLSSFNLNIGRSVLCNLIAHN